MGHMAKAALTALNVGFSVPTYLDYRKEGHGVTTSLGATVGMFAAFEVAAPLMWGLMAKDLVVGGTQAALQVGRANAEATSKSYKSNFGGRYQDSQNAYTMRQRGIQAIQKNGLNARSVLGSEARQYFRNGY